LPAPCPLPRNAPKRNKTKQAKKNCLYFVGILPDIRR
jgi:hypothetical protein